MLEYANPRDLVEEVTRIIRKVRPDVMLSIDPGTEYVRWHKTDHRMAANNTLDAIRAAEWHRVSPTNCCMKACNRGWCRKSSTLCDGEGRQLLGKHRSVVKQKLDAAMAHVSQWEPSIHHYRPEWDEADPEKTKAELRGHILKKDGHYVEAFRTTTGFNQE
jgi:LmbE family N-acetylglucosaminyl deacetylase